MKGKKIIASLGVALGAIATMVACSPEEEPKVQYNVVFKNGDSVISETKVNEGEYYAVPANPVAEEGYLFAGWDANGDNVADAIKAATADITYQALFVEKTTTVIDGDPESTSKKVTFKDESGNVVGVVLYEPGNDVAIVEPEVPAKVGYDGSWEAYTLGDADIEVKPSYKLHNYKITFVGVNEGGTLLYNINTDPSTLTPPAVPAKDGYTGVWEEYDVDLANPSDIVVNPIYTEIPAPVIPTVLDDFAGYYELGQDKVTIQKGSNKVILEYYDAAQEGVISEEFIPEEEFDVTDWNTYYYYSIEDDVLSLKCYDEYIGGVQTLRTYELVDGKVVAYVNKAEQVSAWGTYEYINGDVVTFVIINDEGITYNDGTNSYKAANIYANNSFDVVVGEEVLLFEFNDNYNYVCQGHEFVKAFDESLYGYYYNNSLYNGTYLLIFDDSTLNLYKQVKATVLVNDVEKVYTGYEYNNVVFVFDDVNGEKQLKYVQDNKFATITVYYPEYKESDAVYPKASIDEIDSKYYGSYRSASGSAINISKDSNLAYCEYVDAYGNQSKLLFDFVNNSFEIYTILDDGGSVSIRDNAYNLYILSYSGEMSNNIPTELQDFFKNNVGKILSNGENIVTITEGDYSSHSLSAGDEKYKFSINLDGYSGSEAYFFGNDNKLYLFKDLSYSLSDEIIFEIVDGVLKLNDSEFKEYNVGLADIAGIYVLNDKQLKIEEESVTYNEKVYTVDSVNGYVINLVSGEEKLTITYNPDNKTITLKEPVPSDVHYEFSPELSYVIPEELYGKYVGTNHNLLELNEDGILYNNAVGSIIYYDDTNLKFSYVVKTGWSSRTVEIEFEIDRSGDTPMFTSSDGEVFEISNLEIPYQIYGSYADESAWNYFTLDSNGITYNGSPAIIISYDVENKVMVISADPWGEGYYQNIQITFKEDGTAEDDMGTVYSNSLYGKYVCEAEYYLEISPTGMTYYNGVSVETCEFVSYSNNELVLNFDYGYGVKQNVTFTFDGNIVNDDQGTSYTRDSGEVLSIPSEWVGTWSYSGDNGDYTLVITADSIVMTNNGFGETYTSYVVTSETTFTMNNMYEITYSDGVMSANYFGTIFELVRE